VNFRRAVQQLLEVLFSKLLESCPQVGFAEIFRTYACLHSDAIRSCSWYILEPLLELGDGPFNINAPLFKDRKSLFDFFYFY
jgi:hypothetical protein